jgi:cytochrome c oxidase subunit 2
VGRIGILLVSLALSAACAHRQKTNTRVIALTAKRFEFSPSVIKMMKDETVLLELSALDTAHGFSAPDLHLSAKLVPGTTSRLVLTATRAGSFDFHCSVFCGDGHEDMVGQIVVEEP